MPPFLFNPTITSGPDFGGHVTELLEVVKEWDQEVRAVLPPEGFWFAPLTQRRVDIDPENLEYKKARDRTAREDLRAWLKRVGIEYKSPHKFRHGHIQWGLLHAKDRAQFKAISENVMHANTQITDEIYSSLKEEQLREKIKSLGRDHDPVNGSNQQIIEALETLIQTLKMD